MAGGTIYRITLFKIPGEEDQKKLLAIYKEMPTKAVKVSPSPSPAGPPKEDPS